MVGIDVRKLNKLSWLYIPEKDVLPHRVSFPSNYSPKVSPLGKSSVLAEITCMEGDNVWKMKNKEIIAEVIDDLSRLKIIKRKDVCFARTHRTKYAYVINDINYDQNMQVVRDYMNNIGIDLVGRFAEFKYLNMDACIERAEYYVKKDILEDDQA